ncbi:squalene--hopene cyclase [Bacillus horti]|uniref:Sporulenol synthase n=1 Tax=Caldalkalibacillus horti TaxID=77523 RepID=A0ABT9VYR6_9BACI|nr:squalene--hopene cyclase [Bacillus horti]MDQ0165750.1 sporulenol synthase [Bacillus horti]
MSKVLSEIGPEIHRLTTTLIQQQKDDGSWHFCFENGMSIDAFVIILLRSLNVSNEELIHELHDRILIEQQPEGHWKLFHDDHEGNLSASIDAYYALLYSGYSHKADEHMIRAKNYIQSRGGLAKATSILTKAILAATGQAKWPASISSIPLEGLLLPTLFPINLFDFSGYSRVHFVPMLIMANRKFSIQNEHTPLLTDLQLGRLDTEPLSREFQNILNYLQKGLEQLIGTPHFLHNAAITKAEQFMLERIEPDGTLYSYASSTILMIFSLLALGYDRQDPLITHAVQGIIEMQWRTNQITTIQNSPSTVWDTALIAYAMQESELDENNKSIQSAATYLYTRQHYKLGDWSIHNPNISPGGWGFSESNTINPDVDDTTAALRAIESFSASSDSYLDSWNRGLFWVISMQNDDGGWPAFEKNTNKEILTWIAIDGARSAAIDPSEADLTGRTLEYLGNFAGLDTGHDFIQRGTKWLMNHQEQDGSWYGRWGICYIYGTWAALTGLTAVGVSPQHATIQKGVQWLLSIQNTDGGWGESCRSDKLRRYIPLGASTPSQTAWALDALIAVHPQPTDEIDKGIRKLITLLHEDNWMTSYPTGAGLPGMFYIHYHSYRHIWPLVALSHYRKKYENL